MPNYSTKPYVEFGAVFLILVAKLKRNNDVFYFKKITTKTVTFHSLVLHKKTKKHRSKPMLIIILFETTLHTK